MLSGPLLAQSGLTITSPSFNSVVNPGQSITIQVNVPSGLLVQHITVAAPDLGTLIPVPSGPPFRVSIEIPQDAAPQKYVFGAFGTLAGGNSIESNEESIDVERSDHPAGVKIQPSTVVNLPVGHELPLAVRASYNDGTNNDVSNSTLTTYTSKNPRIAQIRNDGVLTAISPGSTEITITNAGVTALVVPVSVPNFLSVIPAEKRLYASATQQFDVIPTVKKLGPFTWSVSPLGYGLIDEDGRFFVSPLIPSVRDLVITATSLSDRTKMASAHVTVYPALT